MLHKPAFHAPGGRFIQWLAKMPPWMAVLVAMVGAQVVTAAIASAMSEYFYGRVAAEILIIGVVCAFFAATLIGGALVYFGHQLMEGEKRYRTLFQSANVAIGITDVNGKYLDCNDSWHPFLGYSRQEMLSRTSFEITHPLDRQATAEIMASLTEGPARNTHAEKRYLRKDGQVVWGAVTLSPLFDRKGNLVAVMGVVQDIDARKQAELALRAAKEHAEDTTRIKDKFVALVAHDVRGPVSAMVQMARALEADQDPQPVAKHREWAALIAHRGESIVRMAEDLLRLNRLQSGQLEAHLETVDAWGAAQEAMFYAHQAKAKGITLVNQVPPETLVRADGRFLTQVLTNLVANAIKFCRRGDLVEIALGEGRTLTVRDTGPGMEEAFAAQVFDPSVKTTTPGSGGEAGSGLGLPLCAELMAAQGGRIWVKTAPGAGASFYIQLPPKGA